MEVSCTVTCLFVAFVVAKLGALVWEVVYPFLLAKRMGHLKNVRDYGAWAVITGATDGIGKGYAKELASRGLNIFLISRSPEKLKTTADEIKESHPNLSIKTLAFDFSTAAASEYAKVEEALKGLEIGILVNNVGVSYDYATLFLEIPGGEDAMRKNVIVNTLSHTEMTRIVLPRMVARSKGAVINVASASALNPSPYLNVYAAAKSYVDSFTKALQEEYRGTGVFIQCVLPFFVKTKMSRVKRSNFMTPEADFYAKCAVDTIGVQEWTFGCLSHAIQGAVIQILNALLPERLRLWIIKSLLKSTGEKIKKKLAAKKD